MIFGSCNGVCPAPGACELCNQALFIALMDDPAIVAFMAEWERTSGPLELRGCDDMG